jgi:hypothetical protein
MALLQLYSWTPPEIGIRATFRNRGSQFGSRTDWGGICAGQVAVWLRNVLTDGLNASQPNPSRAALLHAKWTNTFWSQVRREPEQNVATFPESQARLVRQFNTGILTDAGLRIAGVVGSLATVATADVVSRPAGYYIDTSNHVLGLVTNDPGNHLPFNYYYYDPIYGVFGTSSRADLAEVDNAIAGLHSASPQYRMRWEIYRVLA